MKTLLLALLLCVPVFAQNNQNNFGGSTSSGNGVGSGASPVMAFYLSPNCPASNTGNCYQTPANTQIQTNCTTSTSNGNVICASGTFTAADVGKKMFGSTSCNPFLGSQALLWATPVTINSFTNSTTVVVSANSASNLSTVCIVWGTPDDTAAAALDTFIQSAANTGWTCPRVELAASSYMFTAPHFYTQPGGCLAIPSIQGNAGSQGNMYMAAGFELEGRGAGATIIYLPPDFPESDSCTHGNASTACFAVPLEGRFSNFQITGTSGLAGTNIANGHAVINVDVGSLDYFTCTGIANGASGQNHIGVDLTHWAQLQQVNVSSCGDAGVQVESSAEASAFRLSSENVTMINTTLSANLRVLGKFTCYFCHFYGSQGLSNNAQGILQNAGLLSLYQPYFNISGGTNSTGYVCGTGFCNLAVYGGYGYSQNAAGTNYTAFSFPAAGRISIQDYWITAKGTGNTISLSSGAAFINKGGNTFGGGAGYNLNSGTVFNLDAQGVTAMTAGQAVLSAGWGSTAAWTSLNGGNSFTGTITNSGTGQAANPTITYTFPTPLMGPPVRCEALQVGGTQANGTFTTSATSATGCTFTYSGTPVGSNTEIIQVFVQ